MTGNFFSGYTLVLVEMRFLVRGDPAMAAPVAGFFFFLPGLPPGVFGFSGTDNLIDVVADVARARNLCRRRKKDGGAIEVAGGHFPVLLRRFDGDAGKGSYNDSRGRPFIGQGIRRSLQPCDTVDVLSRHKNPSLRKPAATS